MDRKRRIEWDENHCIITEAYFEIAKKTKKRPTLKALSDETGISIQSIHKHLKELSSLKLEERFKDLKLMSGSLLMAMYTQGQKGKAGCAKLFFQIVEQFTEKHDHRVKMDDIESMSEEELKAKLKEYQVVNEEKKSYEPIEDDERESAAEND